MDYPTVNTHYPRPRAVTLHSVLAVFLSLRNPCLIVVYCYVQFSAVNLLTWTGIHFVRLCRYLLKPFSWLSSNLWLCFHVTLSFGRVNFNRRGAPVGN